MQFFQGYSEGFTKANSRMENAIGWWTFTTSEPTNSHICNPYPSERGGDMAQSECYATVADKVSTRNSILTPTMEFLYLKGEHNVYRKNPNERKKRT